MDTSLPFSAPNYTEFPSHIHVVLAPTSSRQNLRSTQTVVRGTEEEFLIEWNRVIFSELVLQAWAALLQLIRTHHVGHYNSQLASDRNLALRRPNGLCDHQVDPFSIALGGHRELFVRHNIRYGGPNRVLLF